MSTKIKCIKVTFEGETKRLKPTDTYEKLVVLTLDKFANQGLTKATVKFYYLDDEQELISITSQSDYLEALDIAEVTALKLIIAANASEARMQIERVMGDNVSLASSINIGIQPAFGGSINDRASTFGRSDRIQDFMQEPLQGVEDRRPETDRHHQMKLDDQNTFMDNMKNMFKTAFQEVQSTFTPRQTTSETKPSSMINQEPLKMPEVQHLIDTSSKKEEPKQEVKCETGCLDAKNHIVCQKCKGLKVKPNGKPCNFCVQTGYFCYQGLDEKVKEAQQEVKKLIDAGLPSLANKKKEGQVHPNIICDGCEGPVVGIRYKCSQRDDYDLCSKCEQKGIHGDHVLLKIREPRHAPAHFECKYGVEASKIPFANFMPANFHGDKTINLEELAKNIPVVDIAQNLQNIPVDEMSKTIQNFCGMFKQFGQAQAQQAQTMPSQPESGLKMPEVPKDLEQTLASTAKCTENDDYVLEDVSIVEDLTKDVEKPVEKNSFLLDELSTPKPTVEKEMTKEEIYKLEATAETGYLNVALIQLLELGFMNFERNKELLQKFNLNVEAVASALIEDDELYADEF